jgi:hypothetical protein
MSAPQVVQDMLKEFMKCGKEPRNPERALEITTELNSMGWMIWVGSEEYIVMPTELSLQLLTRKFDEEKLNAALAEMREKGNV